MFIKWIAKIFAAVNSNTKPAQVAGGIAFAFALAMIPSVNLLWILLLLLTLFIKINFAIELVFIPIFSFITPLLAEPAQAIGKAVLTTEALKPFFTELKNTPLLPFTGFEYTGVTGGFILGLILWLPVFLVFLFLVGLYRKNLRDKIINSKFFKSLSGIPIISKFLGAYNKSSSIYSMLG